MGKIEKKSLRTTFIMGMTVTVAGILFLSILAIYGSYRLQKWIMPDSNEVYLELEEERADGEIGRSGVLLEYDRTEPYSYIMIAGQEDNPPKVKSFTVRRENAEFAALTPKRKAAYRFLNVMMFFLPILFSAVGVGICGWWFYRKKLALPLAVLSDATEHICKRDLDFTVTYRSEDELGQLCESFEEMRKTLCENNKELWGMIESRKTLQMSIAHDLRTPITIIKGYVEYLQRYMTGEALSREKERHVLHNVFSATQRLERYTESIRNISQIEETEIQKENCILVALVEDMANDFAVLADRQKKSFVWEQNLSESSIHVAESKTPDKDDLSVKVDRGCLYRVLENIVTNAIRYAEHEIRMTVERKGDRLVFRIADDGEGFQAEQLSGHGDKLFYSDAGGGHLGMGLTVSRILCGRMGGDMKLENGKPSGATVTIWIKI